MDSLDAYMTVILLLALLLPALQALWPEAHPANGGGANGGSGGGGGGKHAKANGSPPSSCAAEAGIEAKRDHPTRAAAVPGR